MSSQPKKLNIREILEPISISIPGIIAIIGTGAAAIAALLVPILLLLEGYCDFATTMVIYLIEIAVFLKVGTMLHSYSSDFRWLWFFNWYQQLDISVERCAATVGLQFLGAGMIFYNGFALVGYLAIVFGSVSGIGVLMGFLVKMLQLAFGYFFLFFAREALEAHLRAHKPYAATIYKTTFKGKNVKTADFADWDYPGGTNGQ